MMIAPPSGHIIDILVRFSIKRRILFLSRRNQSGGSGIDRAKIPLSNHPRTILASAPGVEMTIYTDGLLMEPEHQTTQELRAIQHEQQATTRQEYFKAGAVLLTVVVIILPGLVWLQSREGTGWQSVAICEALVPH
jgi:hypothetical protein